VDAVVRGEGERVLPALGDPVPLDAALHAAGPDLAAGALEGFLDECVAARVVHRDGAPYLALALPPPASAASA
jgi:hypothetical protein